MADNLSNIRRSWNMSRIHSKNTKPEILLRSILHNLGYRFRIHKEDLPGKPDIVLAKFKTVIFVHGCFWHRHNCNKGESIPENNREFWINKLNANKSRDKRSTDLLKRLNWRVLTVWECQLQSTEKRNITIKKLQKQIHLNS